MNNYDLIDFLNLPVEQRAGRKKICFVGKNGAAYPLLFFTHYFTQLRKQGFSIHNFDVQASSYAEAVAQFEMSLLGMTSIYWLKDLSVLSDTALRNYVSYLQLYQGPHTLYFFVEQAINFIDDTLVITMPEVVQEQQYRAIALFFMHDVSTIDSFIKTIFTRNSSISFDKALLLIQYQLFLGRKFQPFIQQWLPRIIISEQSLFTLSQLFFARNYSSFLKEWSVLKIQYPDEFWTVYWSEQVWQALTFIGFAQKGEAMQARSKVYRLPFSFMNKDWKSVSESELIQAHQFLYEVDFGMKNGKATDGIDLFVHKFLLKQFS